MTNNTHPIYRALCSLIAGILSLSLIFTPISAQAQSVLNLPVPGTMVAPSAAFVPMLLKGMTIHPDDPLQFDFIIDSGSTNFTTDQIKAESEKLVKYFLASMTVPKDDLWVNLSPEEPDRIIPEELGKTELGRDMLAQDYILKQLTASLLYPEEELGKKFWDRVYQKAQEQFGTSEIPVNTFNKVWIIPETATVYEHENTVYVTEAHLKVMLDSDYRAMEAQQAGTAPSRASARGISQGPTDDATMELGESIVREIIIPEIEKEVNEGEHFAPLRQIYHSLILAKWYKETIKNSLLSQVYIDQNKIKGVESGDETLKDQIYAKYMEAYQKGVFNYIKEDYDRLSQEVIPRKYISGGLVIGVGEISKISSPVNRDKLVTGVGYGVSVSMQAQGKGASKLNPSSSPVQAVIRELVSYLNKNKEHEIKDIVAFGSELGLDQESLFGSLRYIFEQKLLKPDPQNSKKWTSFQQTYDFNGKPTGRIVDYWAMPKNGEWKKVGVVFVFSSSGKLFLQIRKVAGVEQWQLDFTAGGDTEIGLDGRETVTRELAEEVGLDVPGTLMKEIRHKSGFFHFSFYNGERASPDMKDTAFVPTDEKPAFEIFDIYSIQLDSFSEETWRRRIGSHLVSWEDFLKGEIPEKLNDEVVGIVEVDPIILRDYYKQIGTEGTQGVLYRGLRGALSFQEVQEAIAYDIKEQETRNFLNPSSSPVQADIGKVSVKQTIAQILQTFKDAGQLTGEVSDRSVSEAVLVIGPGDNAVREFAQVRETHPDALIVGVDPNEMVFQTFNESIDKPEDALLVMAQVQDLSRETERPIFDAVYMIAPRPVDLGAEPGYESAGTEMAAAVGHLMKPGAKLTMFTEAKPGEIKVFTESFNTQSFEPVRVKVGDIRDIPLRNLVLTSERLNSVRQVTSFEVQRRVEPAGMEADASGIESVSTSSPVSNELLSSREEELIRNFANIKNMTEKIMKPSVILGNIYNDLFSSDSGYWAVISFVILMSVAIAPVPIILAEIFGAKVLVFLYIAAIILPPLYKIILTLTTILSKLANFLLTTGKIGRFYEELRLFLQKNGNDNEHISNFYQKFETLDPGFSNRFFNFLIKNKHVDILLYLLRNNGTNELVSNTLAFKRTPDIDNVDITELYLESLGRTKSTKTVEVIFEKLIQAGADKEKIGDKLIERLQKDDSLELAVYIVELLVKLNDRRANDRIYQLISNPKYNVTDLIKMVEYYILLTLNEENDVNTTYKSLRKFLSLDKIFISDFRNALRITNEGYEIEVDYQSSEGYFTEDIYYDGGSNSGAPTLVSPSYYVETRPERIRIYKGKKINDDASSKRSSSPLQGNDEEVGGIDMNDINLNRQGEGIKIQFDTAEFEEIKNIGVEGFAPVIINITPLPSVLPLLGLEPRKEDEFTVSSLN